MAAYTQPPILPSPSLHSSSSPSSPHHQANFNACSRPWHSRLPLLAPGTTPARQPPDSTEGERVAAKFKETTDSGASHLIIVLANCLKLICETISLGCDEKGGWKKKTQLSKDELLYSERIQACS